MESLMDENGLSQIIVDAAIEVHRTLGGPGLLEAVYRDALVVEIQSRGPKVVREKLVPVAYKGQYLSNPLRLDLLVDGLVIVECKAVITYNPIFESQVLTYLRLTGLKLGLVINFGQRLVNHGIHRVVNGL
jgi:GxxExxY protein